MDILKVLLIIIEITASILLVGLILLQKSKDQGMGLAFGAGMGEALFGSRAGNVLTKATVILSCIFLADTMLLAIVFTTSHETSIIDQRTGSMPVPTQQQQAPRPSSGAQAPAASAPSHSGTMMPGAMDETPAPAAEAPATTEAPAPAAPAEATAPAPAPAPTP